jgi:hypothetical protein
MARNGAGTYVLPSNGINPAVAGTPIESADFNETLPDIATALTASIAIDGQTTTTARVPFSQGVSTGAGTNSATAYSATSDTTSGLYFPAANQVALSAGGVAALTATSTVCTVPIALTVTGVLSANGGITTTTMTASGAGSVAGAFTASGNAVIAGSGKTLGYFGAAGTTKQTLTGAKAGNAALASVIAALAAYGIVVDSTSA